MRTMTLHLALILLAVSGESRLAPVMLRPKPWGQQAGPTQDLFFSSNSDIFLPNYCSYRGRKVAVGLVTDTEEQEEERNPSHNIRDDEDDNYGDNMSQRFRDADLQIITTTRQWHVESEALHREVWDSSSTLGFDIPLLAYDFELSNHHFQNTTKVPHDTDHQIITKTGKPRENNDIIHRSLLDALVLLEPNMLMMTVLCLGLGFHQYYSQESTETISTNKNPQEATSSRLHLLPATEVPFLASPPFTDNFPPPEVLLPQSSDSNVHWDPNHNHDSYAFTEKRTILPDNQSTKLLRPSLFASDLENCGGVRQNRDGCLPPNGCQVARDSSPATIVDDQKSPSKQSPTRIIIVDDDDGNDDILLRKIPNWYNMDVDVDLSTLYDSDGDNVDDIDDDDSDDQNSDANYIPFRALPTLFPYHIPSGFSLDGMDHGNSDDDDISEHESTNLDHGFHVEEPG